MKRSAGYELAALMAIASAGMSCVGSDAAAWAGTVTDSAGVTLVANPAEGMWSDAAGWRMEPTLTIGTADGDPNLQFGQIAGVALDDAGRIHVLDQQSSNIRTFERSGEYVRTISRKGGGPGEIAFAAGLFRGAGDTLFVADMGARRVARFLTDGTDAGSFPLNLANGIPIRWDGTPGGTLVAQLRPFGAVGGGTGGVEIGQSDVVISMGSDGANVDTLLTMPAGETIQFQGQVPTIKIFAPEPIWALGPDGIWFGVNDGFRVSKFSNGELSAIITRDGGEKPVTDADRRTLMRAIESVMRQTGQVPEAAMEQVLQNVHIADNFPAFLQLRTGPSGTLWVQNFADLSEMTEQEREELNPLLGLAGPTWDVFDEDGRYLGQVEMPDRFQPLLFEGEMVYGVWRDELDVQYLMAAQIVMSD